MGNEQRMSPSAGRDWSDIHVLFLRCVQPFYVGDHLQAVKFFLDLRLGPAMSRCLTVPANTV